MTRILARRFDTVTARVTLAIVCALLAVQGVNMAFSLATAPRVFPMVGARWLTGASIRPRASHAPSSA